MVTGTRRRLWSYTSQSCGAMAAAGANVLVTSFTGQNTMTPWNGVPQMAESQLALVAPGQEDIESCTVRDTVLVRDLGTLRLIHRVEVVFSDNNI